MTCCAILANLRTDPSVASLVLIATNTRRQLRMILFAGASQERIANSIGLMLHVPAGYNADRVATEDKVVDATSELGG